MFLSMSEDLLWQSLALLPAVVLGEIFDAEEKVRAWIQKNVQSLKLVNEDLLHKAVKNLRKTSKYARYVTKIDAESFPADAKNLIVPPADMELHLNPFAESFNTLNFCLSLIKNRKDPPQSDELVTERASAALRGLVLSGCASNTYLGTLETELVKTMSLVVPGRTQKERDQQLSNARHQFWCGGESYAARGTNDLFTCCLLDNQLKPPWKRNLHLDGARQLPPLTPRLDKPTAGPGWFTGYSRSIDVLRQMQLGPDAALYFLSSDMVVAQAPVNTKACLFRIKTWAYFFATQHPPGGLLRVNSETWLKRAVDAVHCHASNLVSADMKLRCGGNEISKEDKEAETFHQEKLLELLSKNNPALPPNASFSTPRKKTGEGYEAGGGHNSFPLDALTYSALCFIRLHLDSSEERERSAAEHLWFKTCGASVRSTIASGAARLRPANTPSDELTKVSSSSLADILPKGAVAVLRKRFFSQYYRNQVPLLIERGMIAARYSLPKTHSMTLPLPSALRHEVLHWSYSLFECSPCRGGGGWKDPSDTYLHETYLWDQELRTNLKKTPDQPGLVFRDLIIKKHAPGANIDNLWALLIMLLVCAFPT